MSYKRNVQEPLVEEVTPHPGAVNTKITHPAFGQISVSRVSGRTNLYGSDFGHNSYVTLTIKTSALHRSLSSDWHFDDKQIIQIAMSEAQWATFVSSFNIGGGVPCTLQWMAEHGYIAELPDPKSRADQFGKEFQQDFTDAVDALDELRADLEASGLSRKKIDALIAKAHRAKQAITSSAPFVADRFGEHMESEMERAKVEIHGYATQLMQRAGIAALSNESPVTLAIDTSGDAE